MQLWQLWGCDWLVFCALANHQLEEIKCLAATGNALSRYLQKVCWRFLTGKKIVSEHLQTLSLYFGSINLFSDAFLELFVQLKYLLQLNTYDMAENKSSCIISV